MAHLATDALTLADWATRQDPNGKTAKIAELLAQKNDVINDVPFVEGNLPTGHKTTVRTGLPTVYWRLVNKGVATSKSTTAQITESIGMLEARSEVDVDLATLSGDLAGLRLSEAQPFLSSMAQEMASTMFYGNSSTDPEEFNGLSLRYAYTDDENGVNIIDAAGSGSDNSSIWLVYWGEETCHGIYPKGSQAGLLHEDLGIGDAFDASNNRFRAYMDRWQWKCGLVVRDWRYVARVANIDISELVAETGADLIEKMNDATFVIPDEKMGKPVWYMNRTVLKYLTRQRTDKVTAGGGVTVSNVDGVGPQYSFGGIPIHICDALTVAEGHVTTA